MLHIGCHLSSTGGFAAMGRTALSIGADTFQFFTRNPRGSKAKAVDPADAAELMRLLEERLPIKRITDCMGCCLTQDIVHIMNMDDMYIAMMDDEKRVQRMLNRLVDDYLDDEVLYEEN